MSTEKKQIITKKYDRPIDSQKSRVYKSEKVLRQFDKKFKSVEDVTEFGMKVIKAIWFQKNFPGFRSIVVEDGAGKRRATGWREHDRIHINMPRFARVTHIILHEMAHGLAPRNKAGHGREYCAVYLKLVRRFMGANAARLLREEFRKNKVRYRPPSKGNMAHLAKFRFVKKSGNPSPVPPSNENKEGS